MNRFCPDMYKKDLLSIDYKKLKDINIKALLFDLDNTLIESGNYQISKKIVELFNKLKKDFKLYIVSNSINHRKLRIVAKDLEIPYIKDSRKPFKRGFKKLKLENIKPKEIAMIGDQVLTDIWGARRMGYYAVLVDPINNKEWIGTKLNRILENRFLKKENKKRGDYFD